MSEPKPVQVHSAKELEQELARIAKLFVGKESDTNWEARDKALVRVRGMLRGGVHEEHSDTFMQGLKGLLDGINETLHSPRTSLVLTNLALLIDLARYLNTSLDPMLEVLLQNLLKTCASTKKLISQAAANAVNALLQNTSYHVRSLNAIQFAVTDKNAQLRTSAAGFLKTMLEAHGNNRYDAIARSGGVEIIEKCLRKGVADANPTAREISRETYRVFWELWQDRAQSILNSVDASTKKQLIRQLGKLYTASTQGITVPNRPPLRPASRSGGNGRASALGKHVLKVNTDEAQASANVATKPRPPSSKGMRSARPVTPSTPSAPVKSPPLSPRRPSSRMSTTGTMDGRPMSPVASRRLAANGRSSVTSPPPGSPTYPSARNHSASPPPMRPVGTTRSSSPGAGTKRPTSPAAIGRRSQSVASHRGGVSTTRRPASSLGHRRLPLFDQLKHSDSRVRVEGLTEMTYMIHADGSSYEALVESKALPPAHILTPILLSLFTDNNLEVVKTITQQDQVQAITQVVSLDQIISRVISVEGIDASPSANGRVTTLQRLKQNLSDYFVAPALCRCVAAGGGSSGMTTKKAGGTGTTAASTRRKVMAGVIIWMREIAMRVTDESNGDAGYDARCYFADMSNFKLYLTRLFPLASTTSTSSVTYANLVELLIHLREINHVLFEQVLYSFDEAVVSHVEEAIGMGGENEIQPSYDDEEDEYGYAQNGGDANHAQANGDDEEHDADLHTENEVHDAQTDTSAVTATATEPDENMYANETTQMSTFDSPKRNGHNANGVHDVSPPAHFNTTVTSFVDNAGGSQDKRASTGSRYNGLSTENILAEHSITRSNQYAAARAEAPDAHSPPSTPRGPQFRVDQNAPTAPSNAGLPASSPLPANATEKIGILQRALVQLRAGNADSLVFRKLIRLAKETSMDVDPELAASVWGLVGEHFTELVNECVRFLERESDAARKEYCVLLIKQLLHCEATFLGPNASTVLHRLMTSRADDSHAVCSAADDALDSFVMLVDRQLCLVALISLLDDCAAHSLGKEATQSSESLSMLFGLKTNPLAVGYALLAKLLRRHDDGGLQDENTAKIARLATEGLNNNVPEVRKSAVDLIVALNAVPGVQLDPHLTHLSVPQRKLIAVYINRSQTVR
ncbi:clasp N terminal-domain-containing protein [Thamnocephalis sphaerospora]|uniref:Clasp N terminal-domain-containing protein n=1 Tax=Thamnocephalis sphaerospora TaxID=78915 RepID=A0A4P9XX34_9FUNG|nr:clasp N terminal-domain-containing protein [Thamnocephalis sphaerospora]|eukprot:RKP10993.1 clasp N terminal-domain-containing protein [Thamnocephalis sphaerospora]